jgi:hypothetical protein
MTIGVYRLPARALFNENDSLRSISLILMDFEQQGSFHEQISLPILTTEDPGKLRGEMKLFFQLFQWVGEL